MYASNSAFNLTPESPEIQALWVNTAPFGLAVVPLVYQINHQSYAFGFKIFMLFCFPNYHIYLNDLIFIPYFYHYLIY